MNLLRQFAASLQSEPMFIAPHRVPALLQQLAPAAGVWDEMGKDMDAAAARPQIVESNGVAVIPVNGVLVPQADTLMRLFGFIGCDDVCRMVEQAQDAKYRAVVLAVDSPGGSVTGTPETAAAVRELRNLKPVIAHTAGLMCSGAYYLSAGASAIYAAAWRRAEREFVTSTLCGAAVDES